MASEQTKEARIQTAKSLYSEPDITLGGVLTSSPNVSVTLELFPTVLTKTLSSKTTKEGCCGCCCTGSRESIEVVTIPKFRIKDVEFITASRTDCACCCGTGETKSSSAVILKMHAGAGAGVAGGMFSSFISNDISITYTGAVSRGDLLNYVYGPLTNSGDSIHALAHLKGEGLASVAQTELAMDRL